MNAMATARWCEAMAREARHNEELLRCALRPEQAAFAAGRANAFDTIALRLRTENEMERLERACRKEESWPTNS